MTDTVQLLAVAVSLVLFAVVLDLVRRRRLREEYSFLWIAVALALCLLSLWRRGLHLLADLLGIYYPPIVLVLVLTLAVFVGLLNFSVVVSDQRRQIEQLVEDVAILEARIDEMPGDADTTVGVSPQESSPRGSK